MMKHGVLTVLKLDLPYGDGIIGYTMGERVDLGNKSIQYKGQNQQGKKE
jgi:hypothetical protein